MFVLLIIIPVYAVITYGIYWVIKRFGFPKVAKGVIVLSSVLYAYFFAVIAFEDRLFSKNDARDLLGHQEIVLKEDFKLAENKSLWSPGDYYHTFTLKLSASDKARIAGEMHLAAANSTLGQDANLPDLTDWYNGKRLTANYETDTTLVRKLFQPNGRNHAPTYRIVTVSKRSNALVFKDIEF